MPAAAVHVVAPGEVNCCVAPRFSETLAGEIVCGFKDCSVTVAEADPPGPVAVTVTVFDEGMAEGAVYKPAELTDPAVAVHAVAPEEVNCCVAPSVTVADVGEIVCGGGGPVFTKEIVNGAPHKVDGFITWNVVDPAVP